MNWKFYALLLVTTLAPFIGTIVAFYQRDIAASLGIPPMAFAGTFTILALTAVTASLMAGHIIDKYGEVFVLTAFPIIYTAGMFALCSGAGMPFVYIGMALIGGGTV